MAARLVLLLDCPSLGKAVKPIGEKHRLVCVGLLVLTIAGHASPAFPFSSPNVPIGDPVYREIDKLAAFGLVPDILYGQRPWSRSEIARIIGKALQHRADRPEASPADRLLEKLKNDYREELVDAAILLHPLKYVEAEYTFLDSESRPIPDNGFGAVDALIEPLTAYQEGRHFPDGHQLAVETEHDLRASRYFSFYARPRLQVDATHGGDGSVTPFAQQLYGKFQFRNTELEVGRDSIEWGQGEFGGVLLSNNARPFDLIKLSNPSPAILPWIFQYLGPLRYTFFVANLGPEREFPNSFLTALKVSLKPVAFFELGIDQILVWGGEGAPGPLTPGNVVKEFFGFRPSGAGNLSNREFGFDLRLWLPWFGHAQLYLDTQIEDIELGTSSFMLTDLASYQAGLYLPRLDTEGKRTLRLEYHHGSPFFYRHAPFTTGMAMNRRLWGDELGPQGDGVSLSFSETLSPELSVSPAFQYERRDSDLLTQTEDARSENRHLVLVAARPEETRWTWKVAGSYQARKDLRMGLELAYQRIQGFNFSAVDDRNAFLGRLQVRWDLF